MCLEFGYRGQRGLPVCLQVLPMVLIKWLAQRRRRLGWYDKRTLMLFRHYWLQQGDVHALLTYSLFRRDLGWYLRPHHAQFLAQHLQQLPAQQQTITLNLLAETHNFLPSQQDTSINSVQTRILAQQMLWRAEFEHWLQQQSLGGICVVGNSGSLLARGLGSDIDKHQVVVRFNQFRGQTSHSDDLGQRINVWVTAPNCDSSAPTKVSWLILTGTVAFKLQNWTRFEEPLRLGHRILTVPLEQWRVLVKQLQAPPSAGLLFLAWLRHILGSWHAIKAVGFGYSAGVNTPYHHAKLTHTAVSRHHWAGELALLHHWQTQGLNIDLPP